MCSVSDQSKIFKRDGRAPIPHSVSISNLMSANKSKNTKPELIVRKALFASGIRGYRNHVAKLPGKPDIVFASKKIAVFIHGCFWHRCPYCKLPIPKSNTAYWEKKLNGNVARDQDRIRILLDSGWMVVVVWECEIYKDLTKIVTNIKSNLSLVTKL